MIQFHFSPLSSCPRSCPTTSVKKPWALACFFLLNLATGLLFAQNDENLTENHKETLLITAEKRETSLQETSAAVSAINATQLEAKNLTAARDVQFLVPNLNFGQFNRNAQISLRGIGNQILTMGSDPGVAFHIDGTYVARSQFASMAFHDLEQIEVLRGPQGALYGRNAAGGIVNYITKKPTGNLEGHLSLGLGKWGEQTAQGVISGPLVEDKVLGRFSAWMQQHDGYTPNIFTGDGLNDADDLSIRGQLTFIISDTSDFILSIDHNHQEGFGPGLENTRFRDDLPLLGEVFGGTLGQGRNVNHNIDHFMDRNFDGIGATFTWENDHNIFRAIASHRRYDGEWRYDIDGTEADVGSINWLDDEKQSSLELQWFSDQGTAFTWMVGLYYFEERFESDLDLAFTGFGLDLDLFGQVETTSYAIFAQANYQFNEQLKLKLGAHYNDEQKDLDETNIINPLDVIASDQLSEDWQDLSPQITLSYQVHKDQHYYLSASKGFKSGGFNGLSLQGSAYDPETLWSYELGSKTNLNSDRIQMNLAAFYNDYKDMQLNKVVDLLTVVTNAGASTIKGLEAEFATIILPNKLNWTLIGTYLNATFDEFTTQDPARADLGNLNLAGNHLPKTPETTLYTHLHYTTPINEMGQLSLQGEYYWQDQVYFSEFNLENVGQASYGISNAYLSFETEHWRFSVYAKNITDEWVKEDAIVGATVLNSPVSSHYRPPRTYGAQIKYSF